MKAFLRKNYCWIIAATVLIAYAIRAGLTNNLNSLFLVPVSEGLHAKRTVVSFSTSLRSIGIFVSNLFFGVVYGKLGFRKLASCGLLVMGLACIGMASSQTVLAYCLFAMLLGCFEAAYSTAAISKLVGEWFIKHRGLVLGIITAASGLGASFFAIILNGIMQRSSWRGAQYFAGGLMVIATVVLFLVVRTKPADMGLKPYGADAQDAAQVKQKKKKYADFEGFTMQSLKKSPVLWLFLLVVFLSAFCSYASIHILIPCLTDNGLSAGDAAKLQSLMFLLLAGAKIFDGSLCDIVGAKTVSIISILCAGVSAFLLIRVHTFAGAILPTVLISIGGPLSTLLPSLSTNEIFGTRTYDTIVGWALAAVAIANMITSPIMNFFFDHLGSYDVGLYCAAGLSVITSILYPIVCRMAKRELNNNEKENNNG